MRRVVMTRSMQSCRRRSPVFRLLGIFFNDGRPAVSLTSHKNSRNTQAKVLHNASSLFALALDYCKTYNTAPQRLTWGYETPPRSFGLCPNMQPLTSNASEEYVLCCALQRGFNFDQRGPTKRAGSWTLVGHGNMSWLLATETCFILIVLWN